MNIMHLNIRSLNKHFEELEVFVHSCGSVFDVIVCTETWQIPMAGLYKLSGYEMIYNDGNINQNDGTVFYVKTTVKHKASIDLVGPIRVIALEIIMDRSPITIVGMYRPHTVDKLLYIEELSRYLSTKNVGEVVFLGDINIDIAEVNDVSEYYLNTLSDLGYIPTINTYTREENGSATCIDHIFVKSRKSIEFYSSLVVKPGLTDHYPVILNLKDQTVPRKTNNVSHERLRIDYGKVNQFLQEVSWDGLFEMQNISQKVKFFIDTVSECVESSCCVTRAVLGARKPWITGGLLRCVKKKEDLYRTSKGFPGDHPHVVNYKAYRNRLTSLIKHAKAKYYEHQIMTNKNSMRKIWDTIKQCTCNRIEKYHQIEAVKDVNGITITNKKDIANSFNTYFTTIATNMAAQIGGAGSDTPYVRKSKNSMYLTEITEDEIRQHVMQLKVGKSPGPDNISNLTLKSTIGSIGHILQHIFNCIISDGQVPQQFKEAIVIPIFKKKGDPLNLGNYRPISLTSSISKVFETCLNKRIMEFAEKYGLLSCSQYGFRAGRSTVNAIASLTKLINDSLDNSIPSLAVFFDLQKAFDSVDHGLLLRKLHKLGLRGKIHSVLSSYLQDRMQSVRLNGICSDHLTLPCGVPQGTVLGPTLFILYIDDLFSLQTRGKTIAYADDTVMFYTAASWEELLETVNIDMVQVSKWFDSNLLTVNVSKTVYMTFSNYVDGLPNATVIRLHTSNCDDVRDCDCAPLSVVRETNYLGVTFDSHHRWQSHVQKVATKLRHLPFMLKRLSTISVFISRIVYNSLFLPVLSYGIVSWGAACTSVVQPLIVIQKRAIRLMHQLSPYYPSNQLFLNFKLLELRKIYCRDILIFQSRNGMLNRLDHGVNTRGASAFNVIVPRKWKAVGQRCYDYVAPKCFNLLPIEIKRTLYLKHFRDKITVWLILADVTALF